MFLYPRISSSILNGRLLVFIVLNENNTNDAFTIFKGLMIMSKKIASLITHLFEDVDITEPAQAFKDAGHK